MKKKRTISIKHPKLQQIRNNLRILLIKAKSAQWQQINDELERVEHDENGNLIHPNNLSKEQLKKIQRLHKKKPELNKLVDKSICKCRRCVKTDQDMTYNPVDKSWYCVECYAEMYNSDIINKL